MIETRQVSPHHGFTVLLTEGMGDIEEDSEFVRNDAEGGEPPFLRKGWKKQPLPEKVRMLSRLRHWCYVEHRSEPSVPVPPTTRSLTEEEINQELESLHKLAFKIANPPKGPANKNPSTELATGCKVLLRLRVWTA